MMDFTSVFGLDYNKAVSNEGSIFKATIRVED